MKKKYYVIPVFGCVEPETLIGPYKSYDSMVKKAQEVHAEQDEHDAIFWMVIDGRGRPAIGTFTEDELDPDYSRPIFSR